MGQKVHPTGYRLATIEPLALALVRQQEAFFGKLLIQDHQIRKYIAKEYKAAGIPRVEIERTGEAVNVIVHTSRPGVLVGRKGVRVDQLKAEPFRRSRAMTCHLTVREIKRPELEVRSSSPRSSPRPSRSAWRSAARSRRPSRRPCRRVRRASRSRSTVASAARRWPATAKEREGRVPLSTLQAHVDFGTGGGEVPPGASSASRCGSTKATSSRGKKHRLPPIEPGGRASNAPPAP